MSRPQGCFVYVICQEKGGKFVAPSKIGISTCPPRRLASFRTATPFPIKLVAQFWFPGSDAAREVESLAQNVAKKHKLHAHGEWIDMDSADALILVCIAIRTLMKKNTGLTGAALEAALLETGSGIYERQLLASYPGYFPDLTEVPLQ